MHLCMFAKHLHVDIRFRTCGSLLTINIWVTGLDLRLKTFNRTFKLDDKIRMTHGILSNSKGISNQLPLTFYQLHLVQLQRNSASEYLAPKVGAMGIVIEINFTGNSHNCNCNRNRVFMGRSYSDAAANTTDLILMPMFSYLLPKFRELQTEWKEPLFATIAPTCPLGCQKSTENKTNIAVVLYW